MISIILRGGLANQLFMISTAIAHSLKTGVPYCIPKEVENPHYEGQKPYIFSGVNYCDTEHIFEHQYNEPHFHYAEIPKHDSLLLNGYFQSEAFFKDYREEILKAFNIPYDIKKGWISCHIRRGDYLSYSNYHKVVTSDYLIEAIRFFKEYGYDNFMFFSDDIGWCKDFCNSFNLNINIIFSEGKTELEDISLASSCEHSIGSASSFSWWIYYLNRNKSKIGIFPKKSDWFGEGLSHNVDDLYNENWVLI